ncbi:hypothetical protein M8C21_017408, partial [Ambrosia artemisiifolia]
EMQDQGFMHEYQMNKSYPNLMEDLSVDSFSSDSYTETPPFIDQSFQTHKYFQEPAHMKQPLNYKKCDNINKKLHTTTKAKTQAVSDTPNTFTISFGDVQPKDEFLSFGDSYAMKNVATSSRNPIQMDKATVLEDAANYIQELQNRVKELEESPGTRRNNMQESVTTGKRSRLSSSADDGSSSYEANFEESSSSCNPEIEVRTSECSLLVEIYSRKNNISLVKVLREMQKLGLSIISCSTLPFADTTLLVTIVAQKNDEFMMTSPDLVKSLQLVV